MMRFDLKIMFLSDWRVGSGLGDGSRADARLARDERGLLYLPGRAIKGGLREGAHRLGLVRADLCAVEAAIFGSHCQSAEGARSFNRPGRLRVSRGRLPEDIEALIMAARPADQQLFVRDLTVTRSQTALEGGLAKAHSLRTMECGLPGLYFHSELTVDGQGLPDGDWLSHYFRAVCAMVGSLGANRSRGLGRCRVTMTGPEPNGPIRLPAEVDPNLFGSR